MRTNSVAISVLACCTFFATLLLYPVLNESTVLRVNKLTGLRLLNEEEEVDRAAEQGGLAIIVQNTIPRVLLIPKLLICGFGI
jgi:hypothetical protein